MGNENNRQIVLFKTEDGLTKLEVQLQDETVWLTIDQMQNCFSAIEQQSRCRVR